MEAAMIRDITRPSTARCTLPMYIGFLLGEPKQGSCSRLGEVMSISHDSATHFLQREHYDGKDLYNESTPLLNLEGGTLSVDDSVLDKPYSQYLAFVGYFWSGKHHLHSERHQPDQPLLYRCPWTAFAGQLPRLRQIGRQDQERLFPGYVGGGAGLGAEARLDNRGQLVQWRGQPKMDKKLSAGLALCPGKQPYGFLGKRAMGASAEAGHTGRRFGRLAQEIRACEVISDVVERPTAPLRRLLPDEDQLAAVDRKTFIEQHDRHWHIEQYHRTIKQVCNIEHFQVRSKTAVKNHLFAAICGYVQLQKFTVMSLIGNCYSFQRNLFNEVIAGFISKLMPTMANLNPQFHSVVNA